MSRGPTVVKMSGAGNDFVVLDAEQEQRIAGDPIGWIRRVCRRGVSVGADGVLFVRPLGNDRVGVRFHNPDGGEAFCGNGSRCAARFARIRRYAADSMVLVTPVGEVPATVEDDQRVRLVLPAPLDRGMATLELGDECLVGRSILAGVPHFVVRVASVEGLPLERWGPLLRRHPRFGREGTNVDLLAVDNEGQLAIRTWERGVEGETLSCGSGAVAAAYAARLDGGDDWARLLPVAGVPLEVGLPGPAEAPEAAILLGDARWIFEAELDTESTRGFPEKSSG